ncbi:serine hydrolase [uncultured Erythrobacter sp.]|uniref:serine hydrolase n=1 Tax=uncultured Erythrobacter sp. TaxID=263913 RepID=UPI002632599D|nr:serine hydrolase [uncultured Erythrobacter sp.]
MLTLAAPAYAQETAHETEDKAGQTALEMRAEQVIELINCELDPNDVFTDDLLAAVPPAQFAAISRQLTAQFGAALSVEELDPPQGTRAAIVVRMERAIARGWISVDPAEDNRMSELLFQSFDPVGDTPAKIEADLAALPGDVTWWFGPLDGASEPILASESDPQMPLGSTFKLYVLAALAREVAQNERSWDDVVPLTDARSYPGGMMQNWAEDTPVTLATLATMMISISDNTATDALIEELGRDAVFQTLVDSGHSAPELNNPFLATREMFLLKGGPAERLQAYREGNAGIRAAILESIDDTLVPTSQIQAAFSAGPVALDVEWFGNAADLANLFRFMRETADPRAFEIMGINPSMTANTRESWDYVGYKGGSEPGVLQLTWLLRGADGRDRALVLSWRNETANLDQSALELIAQRIQALSPDATE